MKIRKLKLTDYLLYAAIIVAGIVVDVVTKALAVSGLLESGVGSKPIIEGVLHLTYSTNTGAAWGMFREADQRWIFLVASTVMIVALLAYLALGLAETKLYGVGAALIVSGGIGNMIERVGKGYVVDFIDFCLIDYPIFNAADSFVCIGAGCLMLALIIDIVKEAKEEKKAKESK